MASLPERVETSVPHYQQQHNWDCGLACARMALCYLARDCQDFHEVCKSMQFGHSVWTIDLANLMVHYKVRHKFYTITLGVDKGYLTKSFYKSHFDKDEKRVNDMFENCEDIGISLEKKSLPLNDILQPISQGHLVVSLVDWSYLSCKWCDRKCLPVIPSSTFSCMGKCTSSYQGHFIVVCGYDLKEKLIFYKNPSYREELCCSTMKQFDLARRSYGTDEDLLLIYHDAAAAESNKQEENAEQQENSKQKEKGEVSQKEKQTCDTNNEKLPEVPPEEIEDSAEFPKESLEEIEDLSKEADESDKHEQSLLARES